MSDPKSIKGGSLWARLFGAQEEAEEAREDHRRCLRAHERFAKVDVAGAFASKTGVAGFAAAAAVALEASAWR